MARSSYIYIVNVSSHPVAAFTVKHECRTWLHKAWDGKLPTNVTVLRLRDNARGAEPAVCVTMAMFDMPKLRREV